VGFQFHIKPLLELRAKLWPVKHFPALLRRQQLELRNKEPVIFEDGRKARPDHLAGCCNHLKLRDLGATRQQQPPDPKRSRKRYQQFQLLDRIEVPRFISLMFPYTTLNLLCVLTGQKMKPEDSLAKRALPECRLDGLGTRLGNLIKQEHPAEYQLQVHVTHVFFSAQALHFSAPKAFTSSLNAAWGPVWPERPSMLRLPFPPRVPPASTLSDHARQQANCAHLSNKQQSRKNATTGRQVSS
jgi:hypothetical protein